jgi:hypothetical protein
MFFLPVKEPQYSGLYQPKFPVATLSVEHLALNGSSTSNAQHPMVKRRKNMEI